MENINFLQYPTPFKLLVPKDVFQSNKEQKGDVHAYKQQTKSMKQVAKTWSKQPEKH